MKRDLPAVIRKVSAFLGKPVKEEDIPALTDHLSFDKMKKNDAVNKHEAVEVTKSGISFQVSLDSFLFVVCNFV